VFNRFSDKTKNDFYHRDTFTKYSGKYDYVQLDYNPSVNQTLIYPNSHLFDYLDLKKEE
jgi:hypothetical protein